MGASQPSQRIVGQAYLPYVTLLLLLLCVLLRMVPGLTLGVPYLPDPWVHIRKADAILQSGYFNILGDYDEHWPGINILIALLAIFPGFNTILVGQLIIPLIGGLSLLCFYLLIRRLTQNEVIALVSVVLFGFAAPNTLIMGTTYKEGFARLLLMAGLLAFTTRSPTKYEHLLPTVLFFSTIIPVHHFAFLVAGSLIIFVILALLVHRHWSAQLTTKQLIGQSLGYLSVFGVAFGYFIGFGCFALLLLDAQLLAISLFAYFALFGLFNLWRIRGSAQTSWVVKGCLVLFSVIGCLILAVNLLAVPTFPLTVLPPSTLVLLLPLGVLAVLGGLGLVSLDRVSEKARIVLSSWTYAILGLLILAFLGGVVFQLSLGLILTYRLFIFLLAPIAALAGIGVFAYYAAHPARARLIQLLLLVSLLAVLPVSTLSFQRDPFFGYGCSITPPIQASNTWVARTVEPGDLIVGDHLFTFYLLYYQEHPASIAGGIQLFVEGNTTAPFTIAAYHRYMAQHGFWLQTGVQWATVDPAILVWLATHPSNALIYNNGWVTLYRRL